MQNPTDNTAQIAQIAVGNWLAQNKRFNALLDKLTDDQLLAETAPGRNTGIYLLGHLAAVSDGLLPLLGFGQRLYPEMDEVFLKNPDRSGLPKPSIAELKAALVNINTELDKHITNAPAEDWFTRHNSVSAEDFAKEPNRNKLNVLLSRTTHMGYHMGQMAYLAK